METQRCGGRAAERHDQPLPQRPPAQQRLGAQAEQRQDGEERRHGAGGQPQHELGVTLLAQNQIAAGVDDQTDDQQRQHRDAQWIGGKRIEPKPAQRREQRHSRNPRA